MTKEECIADLKSINATGMECIDYAINALEQQSDDCVSRAELMKLYYECRPTLATNVYEFGEKLQALPPVTPTQRWIPISERLPEDGTWNLFTDGKKISIERYKLDAIDHFYPSGRFFTLEEAIAWQPLPERYEEK